LKSFVIQHPTNEGKYLVHVCLEGPEVGVYYRGKSKLEGGIAQITLPDYVPYIAHDFTVTLTPKYNKNIKPTILSYSEIVGNTFQVYGDNDVEFSWVVHGKRYDIAAEPDKKDHILCGDGPYTYLTNRNESKDEINK
jgi:hypothetical protein